MMKLIEENYLDRIISENLLQKQKEQREERKSSGKLSASKLSWPQQWQILSVKFGIESQIDEYTLRKFQRGNDVEDWFVEQIKPLETQKFLEYNNVIGYCDAIVDTKDWDNKVGIIPLEIKSVTNAKFKHIEERGADASHTLQNALYALAMDAPYHAIIYIASDDYRTYTVIQETADSKKEINRIIKEFNEAMESKTIPLFVPREPWQKDLRYNGFNKWAGMNEQELQKKYNLLLNI